MSGVKISQLPRFAGMDLLLAAQERGLKILGADIKIDAYGILLIGLADILAEYNIGGINEIVKDLPKPK